MKGLKTENDILEIIKNDFWMMEVLEIVNSLHLPDWWIGAGFVRSKVWDYLHGYSKKTHLPDIDVIYFDKQDISQSSEESIKAHLTNLVPNATWQVKNQARMHLFHKDKPYKNAQEGLSRWVETATCIGVRLDGNEKLELTAPLGTEDLVYLIVRPNPTVVFDKSLFEKRIKEKKWLEKWPKLKVVYG